MIGRLIPEGTYGNFPQQDASALSSNQDLSIINYSSEIHNHSCDYEPGYTAAKEEQSWIGSMLGKIWSIPNTIIGLGWGLLGTLFGAKISFGNNSIQFEDHPFMFDGGAITLGNAIAYGKGSGPEIDGNHERQHTYQGQAMGPLYLVGHLIEGIQALINDGYWHGRSNDLEKGPMNRINPNPWNGECD